MEDLALEWTHEATAEMRAASSQGQKPFEIDSAPQTTTNDNGFDDQHEVLGTYNSNDESINKQELPFCWDLLGDWLASLMVASLVVTYWRGTWVLLDILTCNQPASASLLDGTSFCWTAEVPKIHYTSAWQTYVSGSVLLVVGLYAMSRQWWQPPVDEPKVTRRRALIRFVIIYILGLATVCIWRGIWYFLDYFSVLRDQDLLASYWTSCTVGASFCFALLAGNSLLAPPAIFLVDGPCRNAPPLVTTILTSYRSIACCNIEAERRNAQDPTWIVVLDMLISYVGLPWGVVGFWRGFWLLMDQYLWGFTTSSDDLHWSILYSVVIALFCLSAVSEDVVQYIPASTRKYRLCTRIANEIIGRVRTLILAAGSVNFWRAVWYVWDEFLGQSHAWSAVLAHLVGIAGLTTLGSLCSIAAAPSTLGVDAVAHPDCADEPLFFNVPIPSEALYLFSLGRQPVVGDPQQVEPPPLRPPPFDLSFAARLSRQSMAHMSMTTRDESSTSNLTVLTRRHLMVRSKSQFFRSR